MNEDDLSAKPQTPPTGRIARSEISRMIGGYQKFRETYFCGESELFRRLKDGQTPKTLVIACSDSRVDPALLTGSEPGDIFVIRNVASLVPPYEPDPSHHGVSAALEYAVKILQVNNIIVLGHSQCGGIRELMCRENYHQTEFIGTWLTIAASAREEVRTRLGHLPLRQQLRACEQAALLLGIENLLTFPWVRSRVEAGTLSLHAWYFHIGRGRLFHYDPAKAAFAAFK